MADLITFAKAMVIRRSFTRRRKVGTTIILIVAAVAPLRAQTISTELDLTGGYSGEEIRAAASQLRIFGEAPAGVQFFAEAAWGNAGPEMIRSSAAA